MKKIMLPTINLNLIQSIRLVHALMETDYQICLRTEDEIKFTALKKRFGINYSILNGGRCVEIRDVVIDHEKPRTVFGNIERPLIFPQKIFDYCRSIWKEKRDIRFSFAGLITNERKKVLETWSDSAINTTKEHFINSESYLKKFDEKVKKLLGIKRKPKVFKFVLDDFSIWSSKRGRTFPHKSWDESYYDFMSNSEFVLCPSGDYVWSYRFFESIMCGAIPIIENYSPIFEGFRFKLMDDPCDELKWSEQDAIYNFDLCRGRLTISLEELSAEIRRLSNKQQQNINGTS